MLVRIGLAGLAAAAVAWFGVRLLDRHWMNAAAASNGTPAAVEAVFHGPRAEFDRRINRLRQARLLNPDKAIDLDIAAAYQIRGGTANEDYALRIVESVLRSEPDN